MPNPFDLSLLHRPNPFRDPNDPMDRNTGQPQPSNNRNYPPTNLGDALQNRDMSTLEAQERAKMLALLFKKHYPNMSDLEIGKKVRQMLLEGDLHDAAFGTALQNSQNKTTY